MKTNRFWLLLLAGILLLSAAAALVLFTRTTAGTTASISLKGEPVEQIDLSAVTEDYTLTFTGDNGVTNVVEVSPGRIRVKEATCPDQVCVHQGWISDSVVPVVCLPSSLVIQIEDAPGDAPGVDAAVG